MNSMDFSNKITKYLESEKKAVSEELLLEVAVRSRDLFRRQFMEQRQDKRTLRLSGAGHCQRKQWYGLQGVVGEPLRARTVNTFLFGDLCELGLSIVARLAGWQLNGKIKGEDEVVLHGVTESAKGVEPYTIRGHIDDLLYVPEEKKYYLIEYKSMSEYSYRKFENEGLDDTWGYMTQASCYCEALGIEEYILVGMCKNTGHFTDRIYPKDVALCHRAKARWDKCLQSATPPDREYGSEPQTVYNRKTKSYDPTGENTLGIVCSYCAYKQQCWGDSLTQIMKGEKPVWIVKQ